MPAPSVRRLLRATPVLAIVLVTLALNSCRPESARRGSDPQPSEQTPKTPETEPVRGQAPQFFRPPTANLALFESGAEERYFVGTVGRPWTSGTFGCIRSGGYQFHEGLDIRSIERDARGESIDSIMAVADGTIAYVNLKPALSNYGIYLVLRHEFQGWELFTLYAHLSRIDPRIVPGLQVKCGDALGVMGRTANTVSAISKDRAHLHFEIGLLINEHFPEWHRKHYSGQRNDHGIWNGRNLLGVDPLPLFLQDYHDSASFDLSTLIRQQPVLCRALVRSANFPWLDRYPSTLEPGTTPALPAEIVAHELHLSFQGIPLRIIPKTASEARDRAKFQLIEVNPEVARGFPCQKLVRQRNGRWQFTAEGERFLDLLTF